MIKETLERELAKKIIRYNGWGESYREYDDALDHKVIEAKHIKVKQFVACRCFTWVKPKIITRS
jgi:hypothetical protein